MVDCIWRGQELRRFILHRFTVMPNHVHVLLEPLPKVVPDGAELIAQWPPASRRFEHNSVWPLERISNGMKGASSREINVLLGRTGTLWQEESFDHWIRDEAEYQRVIRYIDENPVARSFVGGRRNGLGARQGQLGAA
jgi:putative transposase